MRYYALTFTHNHCKFFRIEEWNIPEKKGKSMSLSLRLFNSELKGEVVLLLDSDRTRAEAVETKVDLDKDFSRLTILAPASWQAMLTAVKNHTPSLIIFYDGFNSKDFVSLQADLHRHFPEADLVPILNKLELSKIRQSRSICSVSDYITTGEASEYQQIKDLILNTIRSRKKSSKDLVSIQNTINPLYKALLVAHDDWSGIKTLSDNYCKSVIILYDFASKEIPIIWAAQRLWTPWVTETEYKEILQAHPQVLGLILQSLHRKPEMPPKDSQTFVVRFSNWLAEQVYKGNQIKKIQRDLEKRPVFLKHSSIRAVEDVGIANIIQNSRQKYG